jgi:hypothetical protein
MFRDIEEVIRIMRVTHLSLTPTVAALVHPSNVPGVRFLVTAGEALTAKVHRDWAGHGLYQGRTSTPLSDSKDVDSIQSVYRLRSQ